MNIIVKNHIKEIESLLIKGLHSLFRENKYLTCINTVKRSQKKKVNILFILGEDFSYVSSYVTKCTELLFIKYYMRNNTFMSSRSIKKVGQSIKL
jgi:hypothetical protein